MLCYSVWILTELAPWQPRLNGGQQRIMETSKSEFMAGIMYRTYCLRPLWCLTPFYLFILTARVFSWYWRCRRELRKRIKETKQKSQKGHCCRCEKFFPPLKWLSMVVICRCAKTCALWIRPDYSDWLQSLGYFLLRRGRVLHQPTDWIAMFPSCTSNTLYPSPVFQKEEYQKVYSITATNPNFCWLQTTLQQLGVSKDAAKRTVWPLKAKENCF